MREKLESLTLEQLREMAKEKGLKASSKTKSEVIEMLSEKGFRQMPILQVGENFIGFAEAVKWIGAQ